MAASGNAGQRSGYEGIIERIFEHTPATRSLFIRLASGNFRFIPGQFISLSLPLPGGPVVRPYTLASNPEDQPLIEIVLNLVPGGPGSAYLFDRRVGDRLSFTGPFGLFTLEHAPAEETVFAAAATAIAPIRPMIRRALSEAQSAPLTLLFAAADSPELIYRQEFESFAAQRRDFHFEPILTELQPGWTGLTGPLLSHLRRLYVEADQRRDRHFYLCGVGQEALAMRDLLRGSGYPRRSVQYEKW